MGSEPLVSVVMPVLDRGDRILPSVRSALNQSYENLELIVVDDEGSMDTSEGVVRGVEDGRVRYVVGGSSVSESRNVGIDVADGDFVAFLDSDDIWYPENIEKKIEYLRENKRDAMVFSKFLTVFSGGETEKSLEFKGRMIDYLMNCCRIQTSSVVVRKQVLKELKFDEDLEYWEDTDLWLRISQKWDIGYIDEILSVYKKDEDISGPKNGLPITKNFLKFCDKHFEKLVQRSEFKQFVNFYFDRYLG